MYYRIAIQGYSQPPWQWKSTVLSELSAVFQWLRLYRTLPQDRLRVFSCFSREEMNEQLLRENQGRVSTSVTAAQFLHERMISSPSVVWGAPAGETQRHKRTTSTPVEPSPFPDEGGMSPLDKRREELERGAGGDHDLLYRFTLPTSLPQVLGWVKLLVRVQQGDFQPEVGAIGSGNRSTGALLDPPISLDAGWQEPGTMRVCRDETEQQGEKIV
jgi:hypothetical protein